MSLGGAVYDDRQAERPSAWKIWLLRSGVTLALGLLAGNLVKLAATAWFGIHYRYELDYGEGIVWQQMLNMVNGHGYAPLGVFPAIVYHYPPVYHLTVHAVSELFGSDPLAAGRAVSLTATLISLLLVGRLAFAMIPSSRPLPVRVASAVLAGGVLAASPIIITWAGYMRVDMLAAALSLAGLALTLNAANQRGPLVAAAVCFVLAIYTKQTSVAAPAAAFVALWLTRPRAAWLLFVLCAMMGLSALAGLSLASQGGFLRHILLYNINRFDPERAFLLPLVVLPQIIWIAIAVVGAGSTWQRLRPMAIADLRGKLRANDDAFAGFLMLVFLLIKTAMIPSVLKSGASDNYFIDWLCAVAAFTGVGARPVLDAALTSRRWPTAFLVAMITIGLPLQTYRSLTASTGHAQLLAQAPSRAELVERIAREPKPVLSDDMVLLHRAGRAVLWEPAITAELSHTGLYDEAAFVSLVRQRRFGFFITFGDRGNGLYEERYNPATADAIDEVYPRREHYGSLVLHLPR
jgi:4-amino-4-deoxy-L-arabinose transferase-like glycosyltransferase